MPLTDTPIPTIAQALHRPRWQTLPSFFHNDVVVAPLQGARMVHVNQPLAASLLGCAAAQQLAPNDWLAVCQGDVTDATPAPVATGYAGHQFGHYVPQLGDGRACMLGEVIAPGGDYWEWQLKGAGPTPYSRRGDGRAVLRSSIREYLVSQAMAGLGIPTTQALCLTTSDEPVQRECVEPGAMVLRVAPSHLRFGHFEYSFYTGNTAAHQQLLDFTLAHYYPQCANAPDPPAALFSAVVEKTARLMAQWQAVGFCHGVMNTDNMSMLGLTLDYGPYGFLDAFNPDHICNHSDTSGRYRYSNQPAIGQWNCAALGHAFTPWLSEATVETLLKDTFYPVFMEAYLGLMARKLGVLAMEAPPRAAKGDDGLLPHPYKALVGDVLMLLAQQRVDYTQWFAALTEAGGEPDTLWQKALGESAAAKQWCRQYQAALTESGISLADRKQQMAAVNPLVVLRNHTAQHVIDSVATGDTAVLDEVFTALAAPYARTSANQVLATAVMAPPKPDATPLVISCSS